VNCKIERWLKQHTTNTKEQRARKEERIKEQET